ncbi:MAG: tetratricopeptide repeat protein, partial [Acidobacteria bacterium]|nr:tetratricopeptide repeat protein [Acidobacteriota bacterium]
NTALDVLSVAGPYLDGEIAYRRGELDAAVKKLEEATRLEDTLKYDEPPGWTVPSRHALGAFLLEAGKSKEAEAVYRQDLLKYPENGWSLWGLAQALEAQGRTAEAKAVAKRFEKAWKRAEIELSASCLCVKGKKMACAPGVSATSARP